jgi:hypothetical protein
MEDYNTNSQAEPSAESKPDSAALQPETNLIEDRRPEKSGYKQPGSIAALLMILAAMVLLTAWLTGNPGEETAAPNPGAARAERTLTTFETDIPTPTATLQPHRAAHSATGPHGSDNLCHPGGDSIFFHRFQIQSRARNNLMVQPL